jgi:hypothetical protein
LVKFDGLVYAQHTLGGMGWVIKITGQTRRQLAGEALSQPTLTTCNCNTSCKMVGKGSVKFKDGWSNYSRKKPRLSLSHAPIMHISRDTMEMSGPRQETNCAAKRRRLCRRRRPRPTSGLLCRKDSRPAPVDQTCSHVGVSTAPEPPALGSVQPPPHALSQRLMPSFWKQTPTVTEAFVALRTGFWRTGGLARLTWAQSPLRLLTSRASDRQSALIGHETATDADRPRISPRPNPHLECCRALAGRVCTPGRVPICQELLPLSGGAPLSLDRESDRCRSHFASMQPWPVP